MKTISPLAVESDPLLDSETIVTTTSNTTSCNGTDGPGDVEGHDDADVDDAARKPRGGESSILGATLNVTSSIIGAGCIGYGGAVAQSGGLVSMVLIAVVAVMTQWSFDLLIHLGLQYNLDSYEALAVKAGGATGTALVMLSKGLFAFGCMVSYIVIVRDNFPMGCRGLLAAAGGGSSNASSMMTTLQDWLQDETQVTVVVCLVVLLPLSLLRDVTPLERISGAKILTYGAILFIVVYLYFTLPQNEEDDNRGPNEAEAKETSLMEPLFAQKWLEVRPGVIQNMGTMVLAFVAAPTLHIFFRSLKPEHRNMKDWKKVSSRAIAISTFLFLGIALFAYMTYWEKTASDLFQEYPALPVVSLVRVFLSVAIMLTYPMGMFCLRELYAIARTEFTGKAPDESLPIGQLDWTSHVIVTLFLFVVTFISAISAESLGAVLNLNGCVCGNLISFILPALFSFRLEGFTWVGAVLLAVGGIVGSLGTYLSLRDLLAS